MRTERNITEIGSCTLLSTILLIFAQGCSNPGPLEHPREAKLAESIKAESWNWKYVDRNGKVLPGTLRIDFPGGFKKARVVRITGSFEEMQALNRRYVQFLFEMRHPEQGSKKASGMIQAPKKRGHVGPLTLPWTIFLPPDLPGRTLLSLMGVTRDADLEIIHEWHLP